MNIKLDYVKEEIVITINHNQKRYKRRTGIKGYKITPLKYRKEDGYFVYELGTLYKKENTENGFITEFNIRASNWLDLFLYKMIKSILSDSEFLMLKSLKDFGTKKKSVTKIKLNE